MSDSENISGGKNLKKSVLCMEELSASVDTRL